jgi:hypothetical protein
VASEEIGGDVLSHRVAPAVPSAQRGLTSEFGMGSGGSPALWPPIKEIGYRGLCVVRMQESCPAWCFCSVRLVRIRFRVFLVQSIGFSFLFLLSCPTDIPAV